MEETPPTVPLFKTGPQIHSGDGSMSSGSTHSMDASEEKHREVKHHLELERQTAVTQDEEKTDAALESTKQEVEVELSEKEVLKARVTSLEDDLNAMEMSMSQALQVADAQKCTMREQLLDEMAGYKTQAEQYALTIAALEEKLLAFMERYQQLTDENEALKQSLQSIADAPVNGTENQGRIEEHEKLQHLVGVLRHQLSLASKDGDQKQTRIQQLEVDIECLRTEMVDHEAELQDQYSKEFEDVRLTLARQEQVIQTQQEEMEQLKQALQKARNQLADKTQECERVSDELARVEKRTENGTHTQATKTHQHLLKVGQRCIGEKHEEVLGNQKSAIMQLRQMLSDLELAKPPVGSHQATLKELSHVRHELLLAKADKAGTAMKTKVGKMTDSTLQVEDLHCDFADVLHSSEKSYSHLVDTLCGSLPVDRPSEKEIELTDNESFQQEVICGRYRFADAVEQHLKGAKPTGHSSNDSKDRVEEIQSARSTEELDQADPFQTITELEALLSSTVEELEQQKCLNQALLKRKNFKELQSSEASRRPRHNCIDQP